MHIQILNMKIKLLFIIYLSLTLILKSQIVEGYEEGLALLRAKKTEEALIHFQKKSVESNLAIYKRGIGLCHIDLKNLEIASDHFRAAYEAGDELALPLLTLTLIREKNTKTWWNTKKR